MSDALKSSRAKIRTFAHDLASERQKQGHAPESPSKKKEPKAAPLPVPKKEPEKKRPAKPETKKPKPIQEPPIKVEAKKKKPKKQPKPKKNPKLKPIVITVPKEKEIPKMPEAPKSAAPIPSFHELQKTTEKVGSEKRPNIGYDATVITDTKHRRFKLFPAIFSSIRKWFKDLTKRKPKAEPRYSVPETSHRKGVIQKATTKSGATFSADSDTIKEHIRQRQQKDERVAEEAQPIEEEHEPETSWSPFTDTGYALLDDKEEDVQSNSTFNVAVEHKKFSDDKHVVAAPETVEVSELEVEETPKPLEKEETPAEFTADAPAKIEDEGMSEARWASINEEIETVLDTAAADEPESEKVPEPEQSEQEEGFFQQFDTNTLTLVLLVMVVGFVAILLISRVVLDYINQPDEPVQNILEPSSKESVLSGAQVVELAITNSSVDRLAAEATEVVESAPVGLVEMPVVSPIGDEISPPYFFELMRYRTSPPLRQVVTTARFVTVNRSTPAVLLHFTDQETMQGEMLQWEPVLAGDFEKLFGLPEVGLGSFEDSTVDGTEVRSISHDGKRVLIYGFISSNTLLITNDSATFAQINQLTQEN